MAQDDRVTGLVGYSGMKVPVRVATTAAITLSGEQTIDGIACVTNDRVLVKDQASSVANGIYVVDTGAWSRAADCDGSYDLVTGSLVLITAGSTNAVKVFEMTTTGTITIGTTALVWAQALFSSITGATFIQAGTGATSRGAQDKMREVYSVKDFGATGDGVTDDTTFMQAAHDALTTNSLLLIPPGTYMCSNLRITKSDIFILCVGALKPLTVTATPVIIGKNASGQTDLTRRLQGNIRVNTGSTYTTYTSGAAIDVQYLIESDLHIDAIGCNDGLKIAPVYAAGGSASNAFVAYNQFRLGNMTDNKRNLVLDDSGASAAVNENTYHGGRFATATFNSASYSVYIKGAPNNNRFKTPSFEGPNQSIYCEGPNNNFDDCRFEVTTAGTRGTDFANRYLQFTGTALYTKLSIGYGNAMYSGGLISHGAGTRVDDMNFTLVGDLREFFYPGAMVTLVVGGTTFYVRVLDSSFGATTAVHVSNAVITGAVTSTSTPSISIAAGTVPFELSFAKTAIPSVSDASTETRARHLLGYIRTALELSGFSTNYPALSLYPGASNAEEGFRIFDLTQKTGFLDHNSRGLFNELGTAAAPPGAINLAPATGNVVQTLLKATGVIHASADSTQPMFVNRKTNDGTLIDFRRDGANVGSIDVAGGVVSLVAFHGAHWSQLVGNEYVEDLPLGTVLEGTEEMAVWNDSGEDNRLCRVRVCNTPGSKAVQGTFFRWDLHPEPRAPKKPDAELLAAHLAVKEKIKALVAGAVNPREVEALIATNMPAIVAGEKYDTALEEHEHAQRDYERNKGCNDLVMGASGRGWVRVAPGESIVLGDLVEAAGNGCARVIRDPALTPIEIMERCLGRIHGTKPVARHPDGSYTVACGLLSG